MPDRTYASSVASTSVNTKPNRKIFVNLPLPKELLEERALNNGHYIPLLSYVGNYIHTSKYTVITFLPKNLFEQFRRVANSFFLLLVILQCFDEYLIVNPIVAAFPIIVIVLVTAIKDAVEDYKRWKNDKQVNNQLCYALPEGKWRNFNFSSQNSVSSLTMYRKDFGRFLNNRLGIKDTSVAKELPSEMMISDGKSEETKLQWKAKKWKNIKVGDFLLLQNDDAVPADIVILSTSEPDCVSYVETKNLDGETSLKPKSGLPDLSWLKSANDCTDKLKLVIESEAPTTNMLKYQATISYSFKNHQSSRVNSPESCKSDDFDLFTMDNLSVLRKSDFSGLPETSTSVESKLSKRVAVDINGVLMRGAVIRNTEWIIGVVVYTGEDTKQVMNFGKTPSKQTNVDRLMNKHVAFNLIFMLLLCLVLAIASPIWFVQKQSQSAPFVEYLSFRDPAYEGFLSFWGGLILFQNIVPISLYISIELVKTIQAYFIHQDLNLYYAKKDTPCQPRSWNLAENLGQIEYIFSDKTGTLTQNIMSFKKCCIGGQVFDGRGKRSFSNLSVDSQQKQRNDRFGSLKSVYSFKASWLEGNHETASARKSQSGTPTSELAMSPLDGPAPMGSNTNLSHVNSENAASGGAFEDEALYEYLDSPELLKSPQGVAIKDFFTLLCLCHTVLVDDKEKKRRRKEAEEAMKFKNKERDGQPDDKRDQDKPNEVGEVETISYNAQSPDEACLVTLAAETGFVFKGREHNSEIGQQEIVTEILGEECKFELLNIIDFDSDRKRMSVIVRPSTRAADDNDVLIFCKGADSVIYERLLPGQDEIMKTTKEQLQSFAEEGLRTLCLAYKKISGAQYLEWSKRYSEANMQVYANPASRQQALSVLNNEIECNMLLLGATAIEDKLQDGVPECITTLAQAGIKIWVLTGDKMETAINIGFLCGLLKSVETTDEAEDFSNAEMVLIQIKNAVSEEEMMAQLQKAKTRFFEGVVNLSLRKQEYALIIDGLSLKYALDNDQAKSLLLEIGCQCKSVICCRVSPLQKAKVVELVKTGLKVLTLAIGDGANDVSMIQAADVGVGISGEEGLQAAMSADYAIAQFCFLSRLLLVHGRWCYSRMALMILNFYLKSLVFTLVIFWFQFDSGFTSAIIYEFTYMLFFNLVFTNLPVLILGLFDQSISDRVLLNSPQLYGREGIPQTLYTDTKFFIYLFESIWHSLVCYYLPILVFSEGPANISGLTISGIHLGTVMAVSAITVVNLSVMLDQHIWNWITHVGNWITFALIYFYILLYSFVPNTPVLNLSPELYPDVKFWGTVVLSVVISLGPRFCYYFGTRVMRPKDSQILEEIDYMIRHDTLPLDLERSLNISAKKLPGTNKNSTESLSKRTPDPGSLARKPSMASVHSITYSMDTDGKEDVTGFSFSSPKGMGQILMKSKLSKFRLPSVSSNITRTLRLSGPAPQTRKIALSKSVEQPKQHASVPSPPPPQKPTTVSDIMIQSADNIEVQTSTSPKVSSSSKSAPNLLSVLPKVVDAETADAIEEVNEEEEFRKK